MYFLLEACEEATVLRTLYFSLLLKDIIFTAIPIGLILMLLVDFSKAVISGDAEEQQKKIRLVPKRILYAVLVFAVPWIVSLIMSALGEAGIKIGSDYNQCLQNARTADFEYFEQLDKEKEKAAQEESAKRVDNYFKTLFGLSGDPGLDDKSLYSGREAKALATQMILTATAELENQNCKDSECSEGKYCKSKSAAWCAFFTTWVMRHTEFNGVNLYNDIITKEYKVINEGGAACTMYGFEYGTNLRFYYSKAYAEDRGRPDDANYAPKAGDLIYFHYLKNHNNKPWSRQIKPLCSQALNGTWVDHIGIVVSSDANNVYIIDGNAGKPRQVKKSTYKINSGDIIGYGSWYDNSPRADSGNEPGAPEEPSNPGEGDAVSIETAKKNIEDYIKEKSYDISVGYYNLNSKYEYTVNKSKVFYGASTIKTLDALYYYSYRRDLLNDTTKDNLKLAIKESNNTAHKALMTDSVKEEMKNYAEKELGVSYDIVKTINNVDGEYGDTNIDTQFKYYKELYSVITDKNIPERNDIIGYYTDSIYNCLKFSSSSKAMAKYGSYPDRKIFHNAGIVLDGDNPYIVVILTKGGFNNAICNKEGNVEKGDIAELSKLIYELHKAVKNDGTDGYGMA